MRKAGAETKVGGGENEGRYNLEDISMGGYRQVETLFLSRSL